MLGHQFSLVLDEMGMPFVIIYFLVIVGFLFFLISVCKVLSAFFWPSVKGEIMKSSLVKQVMTSSTTQTNKKMYSVSVNYNYYVSGKNFSGDRVRFFQARGTSESLALRDLDKYPIGTQIDVFYKPSDPSKSVLVKGLSKGFFLMIFFFVGVLGQMTYVMFEHVSF